MGKPSVPTTPTPPTASEIAASNIETAEHMAKLSRAMEFGEELLRDVRNEDGTRVRYEKVQTDIKEGFLPVYADQEISVSGPTTFLKTAKSAGFPILPDGTLGKDITWTGLGGGAIPAGTPWGKLSELLPEQYRTAEMFSGSQPITQTFQTVVGYNSTGSSEDEYDEVAQYFRIDYDKDGNVLKGEDDKPIRKLVERTEAIDADFTGFGDIDRAMKRWEFEKDTSSEVADHLLAQARKYGLGEGLTDEQGEEARAGFIETAVDMIRESDERGYGVREELGRMVEEAAKKGVDDLPSLGDLAILLGQERVDALKKAVPALQKIDIQKVLELPGEYAAVGAFGAAPEVLGRLEGKAPTTEELVRGDKPGFGDIGAMEALKREVATPGFRDLEYGAAVPTLETRKGEMDTLGRTAAFGELDLEDVQEMTALERATDLYPATGGIPDLEELSVDELPLDPESLAMRRAVEKQLGERAQDPETSRLMADEARRISRGRAADIGNIFGGGAVIEEARAVRQAEDAARAQARDEYMRFLQSGQTAAGYEAQVSAENLRREAMGMEQRGGVRQAEFGMGMQRLGADREAALQERAQYLGGIQQRNEAQEREYQTALQALGMDQQAILAERGAAMEVTAQRAGAQKEQFGMELAKRSQQQTAREADFQSMIQSAGFQNEATMRKRADELGAIAQRTSQQQQDFANLSQIVSQINQARGGQFGMEAQQLEINTQQQMRERADELASAAQRNQAQEAEYQDLLSGLAQRERATQAEFGMQQSKWEQEQSLGQKQDQQRQQVFASAMQKTMSEEQLKQQQVANLQSFSGLAPVSGQFGMMPGAQQAAASAFTPLGYKPTNAMELLQGQQKMAASNFGAQANIFGTQTQAATQPSGFGQIVGTGLGIYAGKTWGG